jgi:hypothetical protein
VINTFGSPELSDFIGSNRLLIVPDALKHWVPALRFVCAALLLLASTNATAQQDLRFPLNSTQVQVLNAQLAALQDEKDSRTAAQRKIQSSLLYEIKRRRQDPMLQALPDLRTAVELQAAGMVLVDIKAHVTDEVLARIRDLGGTIVNSFPQYNAIRAQVPLSALEDLAALKDVQLIRPADPGHTNKSDTSEGDVAHAATIARGTYSVNGSGVQVGVLSDSVDALSSLQSTGDLPAVTVLPGQSGQGESEGTAMLEIVYDLAPGAGLYFATANGGEAAFANNILSLKAAGCDVIVDDVGYFAEPVFQDGIVAQAVQTVTSSGALYFSSAGNDGNLGDGQSGVWEGDYSGASGDPWGYGYVSTHVFSPPNNIGNQLLKDSGSPVVLQWSDAFGASANDYDLILVDSQLNIIQYSTDTQTGTGDPIEQLYPIPSFDRTGLFLVVLKWQGDDRLLHLATNRGRLQFATAGVTSGHSAAENAFSVAAVDVATANGGVFLGGPANPVESFSSDGPRRVFYMANGTPYTPGNFLSTGGVVRQKPDIAAADGVSTATGPLFHPFYGTSAAAPHAAAIAALMLDVKPTIATSDARALFAATALDIEASGVDRDSGYGILMADAVLERILGSTSYTLSVSKAGTGAGAVASNPAGINCGTVCSANFASGSTVTLTATPTTGSTFSGWSGGCTGAGTCMLTMSTDKTVTATFAPTVGLFCWDCLPSRGGWRAILQ